MLLSYDGKLDVPASKRSDNVVAPTDVGVGPPMS